MKVLRKCLFCQKEFWKTPGKIRAGEGKFCSKVCYGHSMMGKNSRHWKGDKVGYGALHAWVKKHLGFPTKCEHCGKDGFSGSRVQWANKSREYKRDLNDWLRLCTSCHRKYDGHGAWFKDKNFFILHPTNPGGFNKGHFKKGNIPWNKGPEKPLANLT